MRSPRSDRRGLSAAIIAVIIVAILLVSVLLIIVLPYNNLVSKRQDVKNTWSNVEVEYQRKIDLIPQVLAAVNTSMGFEQSLLTNITTLRTQWLNTLASNSLDNVNTTKQLDVQLGAFLSVAESNPDVKSIAVIQDFITTVEGTENRIAAQRIFYNDAVNNYNTAIESFPSNLIAGMFAFNEAEYYQKGT